MNQKRSRLQKMHAKCPIDNDDSEVAMLNSSSWNKQREKTDEDPGVVTLARPSEYGVKNSASRVSDGKNSSSSATDRDRMKKKFQHMKMKESFDMMENGGFPATKNDSEEAKEGQIRRKSTTLSRWPSSYLSDGKRLIDFVLAYEPKNEKEEKPGEEEEEEDIKVKNNAAANSSPTQSHSDKRRIFEANLHKLGLELEYANATQGNTKFVLVHAPFKVLLKQAELLMIRKPVHKNDVRKELNLMDGCINAFLKHLKFLDFEDTVKKRIEPDEYFCQPFVVQHSNCFVGYENQETFFSRAERSRMVNDLLIRARYDRGTNMNKLRFGIERLVRNNVYSAAYPIHEELNTKSKMVNFQTCSDRQLLYETWVRMKNLFKYQPLDLVQKYFGTKIAFYFAWLGFYTRCLYSVSLIGVICVIYGIMTMNGDIPNNDICGNSEINHELLCPVCQHVCDYIPLNKTCFFSKLTYVFDNYATIVFTIVMSIWMTVFLEFWKRYHAQLAYRWNVLGYEPDEEAVRPEFQYRRAKMKINPVTKQEEPYVSITEKAFRLCGSTITVLFFVSLVIALLFGIIVYRIIIRQVVYASSSDDVAKQYIVFIFTSTTAASINLVFILIMNYFYNKLALKLTNWECPRTQSEFDNSFTFKVFLFQFVNFYASLFYIAFIKGKFAGIPGNPKDYADPHEMRIGTIRLEQCDAAGCMVELLIQLIVIMVGKQLLNGFFELAYPMFCYWFRRWRLKLPETKRQRLERINKERRKTVKEKPGISLYEKDYMLNSVSQQFLFDEYLEMVIQLGFCSLFVAAFPLAPLFALINNVFEIRFDAYKFIVTTRRPVPEQARNIGIWLTIINMISNVAVLCNAFVIAFTSDFIPKLYYQMTQGSLHGYLNDTLAYFDTDNLELDNTLYGNPHYCRYYDLRRPPCSLAYKDHRFSEMREFCSDNYEFNPQWWVILSLRLIFVLVFELVVLSVKAIFAYIIPDMPTKIIKQLQRERYLMRQAILQRRDSLDEAAEQARADSMVVADVEVPNGIDRPEWEDNDMDSIVFEPGHSTGPQSSPAHSHISSKNAEEFDGLKKLFSSRERPSLSPHASRQDLAISVDESNEKSKSTSSEPALYHPPQSSAQQQQKTAATFKRWPTPSLLVVPPADGNLRRPKTVEVLQKASQQLKSAKTATNGDEEDDKKVRHNSDEIV